MSGSRRVRNVKRLARSRPPTRRGLSAWLRHQYAADIIISTVIIFVIILFVLAVKAVQVTS